MRVQTFLVAKPFHENLIVQETRSHTFYTDLHQHNEIQLSLIVNGTGKLVVGDSIHPFKNGDFFVIGSNTPHLFKNENSKNREVHMISLFFTESTFGKNFFTLPDLDDLKPFFQISNKGFQLLSNINEVYSRMQLLCQTKKASRLILFLQLLQILCNSSKKPLSEFVYPKVTGHIAGERLQVVFDYALRRFNEDIKLKTISDLLYMTPNAFCKFFKQRTNKTFFQFLNELRIEHACQLLQNKSDLSIAEISEFSGFKSISNFNRKFKSNKGVVASKYRKRAQNDVFL